MYQISTGTARKFIYDIEIVNEKIISALKTVKCKYHIISFDKGTNDNSDNEMISGLKGYIYFDNAKSISSVKKHMNIENVTPSNITYSEVLDQFKVGEYWENGILPKHGRKKDGIKNENGNEPEELVITNKLMNETIIHVLKCEIIVIQWENSIMTY